MEAVAKIPLSLTERLEYGNTLRMAASWEEFIALLPQCNYRIEYTQGQIISFMGYATETHEKLVLRIAYLLRQLLDEELYELLGSNLALHIPGAQKRYYNADCTVVRGATEKVPLSKNMYAVANPVLLVEVLSASTAQYDLTTKGIHYREIPSLQQILYISSSGRSVTSVVRNGQSEEWLLRDYTDEGNIAILGLGEIALSDLYRKVDFTTG